MTYFFSTQILMFFLVEKMEWRGRQVSPPKNSLAFFATEAPLFCGDLDPAPTPPWILPETSPAVLRIQNCWWPFLLHLFRRCSIWVLVSLPVWPHPFILAIETLVRLWRKSRFCLWVHFVTHDCSLLATFPSRVLGHGSGGGGLTSRQSDSGIALMG